MAIIGDILITPESGWKRYDDNDQRINYIGSWEYTNVTSHHGSSCHYTNITGRKIQFKFKGTQLRLISPVNSGYSNNISIKIDGVETIFSEFNVSASNIFQVLVHEQLLLSDILHFVEITALDGNYVGLDAIDINTEGYLSHFHLAEKTKISEMEIGDVISCEYVAASNTVGTFNNLGNVTKALIPPSSSAAPNGSFYFIKADENLLIADRVVQHSITWDALNTGGYIEGKRQKATISPILTANNQNGYIVSASSEYGTKYQPWKVFDGNAGLDTQRWITANNITNGWLKLELPMAKIVNYYKITVTSVPLSAPKKWLFEGSNDDLIWDTLDTQDTLINMSGGVEFYFNNTTAYKFYKINVEESQSSSGYLSIDELNMSYIEFPLIRSLSGGAAYIDYLKKKEVALHLPLVSDIVDKSPMPRSVTITGTSTMPVAQEGAGKFGNNSLYFNGTNSTLTLPNNICNFGTRDFTIDCWAKIPLAPAGTYDALISNTNGTNIWHGVYLVDNDASYKIGVLNHTVRILQSTKRIDDDIYHHIVIQRRNGVLQIFIDGILDASINYTTDMNWNIVSNIYIGGATATPTHPLKGYINDLRIIKGTGIYEGNFTPPTELLPKQVSELDIPVMSTTSQAIGAFPNTNEWDRYIVNSDLGGKIIPGDNNVWNYVIGTWSNETAMSGVVSAGGNATTSAWRMIRGYIDSYGGLERVTFGTTSTISTTTGFRPVLQLIDDKQTNFWR